MAKKKIHIDELFRERLNNLSLFVSNKDMEAIDEKKSVFTEKDVKPTDSKFSDFEMEVTDSDWLATKAKFDSERSILAAKGVFSEAFSNFAIEPEPEDWRETMRKYRYRKAYKNFRWLGTGIVLLIIGLGIVLNTTLFSERKASEDAVTSAGNNPKTETIKAPESETPASGLPSSARNESKIETAGKTFSVQTAASSTSTSKPLTSGIALAKPVIKPSITGQTPVQPLESVSGPDGLQNTPQELIQLPSTNLQSISSDAYTKPSNASTAVALDKAPATAIAPATAVKIPELPPVNAVDTPKKDSETKLKIPPAKTKPYSLYIAAVNRIQTDYRSLSKDNHGFYNAIRNNGEQPSVSWTKGFEMALVQGKNMFSAGVLHNTRTIQTQYRYTYKVFDSIPVRNPQGQIIGYFLFNGKDTLINKNSENRISSVKIPFAYNRLIRLNSRLQMLAGASAMLSLNTGSKGDDILNPVNRQLYAYSSFSQMERKFNVYPGVQIGVQYAIGKHLEIQTGFGGEAALLSRFKDAFGAIERPYNAGINLKLLYKLP